MPAEAEEGSLRKYDRMQSLFRGVAIPILMGFLAAAALGSSGWAAWTEARGHGLAISTFSFYAADRQFDPKGGSSRRPPYRQEEARFYAVYGLRDWLTLGLDTAVRRARDRAPSSRDEPINWHDGAFFGRFRLHQWERSVLSIQPLVRVPGPNAVQGMLGRETDAPEAELRLLYGRSFVLFDRDGFGVAEAAYRRRFGPAMDQARFDLTLGLRPLRRFLVLAQSFNAISTGLSGQPGAPDYDIYKVQLSAVRDLTDRLALQLGGYVEYAGRNVGAGQAGFLAVWFRF